MKARLKWQCGCVDEVEIGSFAHSLIDKHNNWFDAVTGIEENGEEIIIYEEKIFPPKNKVRRFLRSCVKHILMGTIYIKKLRLRADE